MKNNRLASSLKKIVATIFILLVLLISFAFAAPYLFKGKIIALVKKQINENINAKADFKDVDISFFRHFPKVSVALEYLQVTGVNEFAGDTLIAAKDIDLSLDILSVVKGSDYKIHSVIINEPRIHAIVTKDGRANWEITKESDSSVAETEDEKPYSLNLQKYAIRNGYIWYNDASSNMSTEIVNLNHEGTGNFNADLFVLKTKTTAEAVNFTYGSIPYLTNAKTSMDANIQVDNKTGTYSFRNGLINLNAMQISTEGSFRLVNDSTYNMDIEFNAPSTDFKSIISLIPAVYKTDFDKVKTSGQAVFNGFVKGTYSNTELPAYNINLEVENGFFQYPDLPKPVKNINLIIKVDNPDGVTDHTVVNIPKAHIEFDNEPFDFRLRVKNPVSDLFIDAAAKGRLDLSKITQFVKLEAGTKLNGLLNADVNATGHLSAIEKQQYDQFHAGGSINLSNFLYASKDYPDGVQLKNLLMTFNPKNVTINDVNGQYLKTNFSANGTINNLLAYVLKDQSLDGSLHIKADKLNLNDWMGVSTDTTATAETSEPFAVPSNINFTVNTSVDQLHYDNIDLQNLTGNLQIANETVSLNNVKAQALDGTMAISGTYSTKTDKKKPDISLTYDVKGLDAQKTFITFNTFQKLMPIGKFISGKISSQLSFTGKLGENMLPDLNSLTGQGNLLLIEGFLKKFTPVDKLAQTLNIKELEAISLKDVKNYIEFRNGKVLVKPFKVKMKEVDAEIGGMHGLDQSLDYVVNLKLPRSLMGEKGNQFVNNLITQVNNKGVPVQMAEIVNLHVTMGGTILNPIIKTDLKQTANNLATDLKQQVTDFAKQKIDSTKTAVKTAVRDTVASVKKQLAVAAKDEIKKQLFAGKDSSTLSGNQPDVKKSLEQAGKGLLENVNPFKKKKKTTEASKEN